jgi:uncharacterized membrane protein
MGHLLRAGVILSAIVVAGGGALYVSRHPIPPTAYETFTGAPQELRSVRGILHSAFTVNGRGLIQLGLLALIATPIARVAFSFVAFLYERDRLYAVFTLFVLALLIYSLAGGAAISG